MQVQALSTRYDAGSDRVAVYLQPGQLHVAVQPTTITTILASCVAVCLFDGKHGIGGMNHFLLPNALSDEAAPARFGPSATQLLIDRLLDAGAALRRLQAKVFGGAAVLDVLAANRDRIPLGQSNVDCALSFLADLRIPVVASDVGGTRGRKVIFRTDDGSALMKFL